MKHLLLLLAVALLARQGAAQVTQSVTLPAREATKIYDSLRVLPLVRQEAHRWQAASGAYRQAADSLRQALAAQQAASQTYQRSLTDQARLTTSATADATQWRSKARKRGVVNGLLAGAVGVLAYLAITR